MDYKTVNKKSWNQRTALHLESAFYKIPEFMAGASSLQSIELDLLGDLKDKKVLHLQCHFGQDSISLSRLGAEVTAVDFSEDAIAAAKELAEKCGQEVRFITSDVYDLAEHLDETFDWVFTSYGVLGWLPDMAKWANLVERFVAPGGQFLIVEFHPVLWMFDEAVEKVTYSYFNTEPILETLTGSYADPEAEVELKTVTWNHDLQEVLQNLLDTGLVLQAFREYDYSPYPIFEENIAIADGRYCPKGQQGTLPLIYALKMHKPKS